jgi:hypothetical protein
MKKIFFTPLLAVLALMMGGTTQAQSGCDAYYPMRTGSMMELTHYNAKGKADAITKTEINEKERDGSRIIFEATATSMDEKRKELSKNAYTMSCDGGEFRMDMRGSMGQMQQMEGVTMEIDADELIFPNTLTTGQELPEGSMTIKGSMNGMQIMNNTIRVYNRKVTGTESKTTPAGTFDCVIIEEDTDGSVMGMKFTTHTKTWISKGAGMVRSESYKNGKLESYSELTKLVR